MKSVKSITTLDNQPPAKKIEIWKKNQPWPVYHIWWPPLTGSPRRRSWIIITVVTLQDFFYFLQVTRSRQTCRTLLWYLTMNLEREREREIEKEREKGERERELKGERERERRTSHRSGSVSSGAPPSPCPARPGCGSPGRPPSRRAPTKKNQ